MKSNLIILKQVNLHDYLGRMHDLYFDLAEFLKSKFNDEVSFEPNERILFLLPDLDFYLQHEFPGFFLYNLQLILKDLDIPNYFCILVSNMPNINKYLKAAQHILTSDSQSITGISSLYYPICQCIQVVDHVSNFDFAKFPFIVLSRQSRFHRTYFVSQLFNKNLQHHGLVAYNNIPNLENTNKTSTVNIQSPCVFLTTDPVIMNNQTFVVKQKQNQLIVSDFQKTVTSYKNFNETIDINNKDFIVADQNDIIGNALIYLGLETTVNYPEPFLSTISFKGIVNKRPFIIFGVPGTVAYLRDLGFKTFSSFWDESYDSIQDHEERCNKILEIVMQFSTYAPNELKLLLNQMEDILEYNFNHYKNKFCISEKNKLKNLLQ